MIPLKKFLYLVFILLCMLIASTAYAEDISVLIDSSPINFTDISPQVLNDRVMVPMRIIFEQLGANVVWNGEDQTITATKDSTMIILKIDDTIATVNGKQIMLDAPPTIISDRTVVPVRFISESLGLKVNWNGDTHKVYIYSNPYLNAMNNVKLAILIKNAFGDKIHTSLGDVEVLISVMGKSQNTIFDYFATLGINQYTISQMLNNPSYSVQQKEQLKSEIKAHMKNVADFIIDITSNNYMICGSYAYKDNFIDSQGNQRTLREYFSWANYDVHSNTKDTNGFRWTPEYDDEDSFK